MYLYLITQVFVVEAPKYFEEMGNLEPCSKQAALCTSHPPKEFIQVDRKTGWLALRGISLGTIRLPKL